MSGTARDVEATSGAGISQVEAFLGTRDQGGQLVGIATLANSPTAVPGAWSLTADIPEDVTGGQSLVVYGTSSVSGQQAFVSIPVVVGEALTFSGVSDDAESFCPSVPASPTPVSTPIVTPTSVAPLATTAPAPTPPAPTPTSAPPAPAPIAPAPAPAPAAPVAAPVPAPASVQLAMSSPASPPLSFNTQTLTATADSQATLTYSNDSPIPHNWHLFNPSGTVGALAYHTADALINQYLTSPGMLA